MALDKIGGDLLPAGHALHLGARALERFGRMTPTAWTVVTGAPGSGKSTVVSMLSARGISTEPDIARELLADYAAANAGEDARSDLPRFRANVFMLMAVRASSIAQTKITVFDYALPDNVAFYKHADLPVPEEVRIAATKFHYRSVAIFAPATLTPDRFRVESGLDQASLDSQIKSAYCELGYRPHLIKLTSAEERVARVLSLL